MGIFLLWRKMANPLKQGFVTDSQLTSFYLKKTIIFFSLGSRKTPILALCLMCIKCNIKAVFMQNISSLTLILWELLKIEDERWLSLIKILQFFDHISAPRQKLFWN